MTKTMPMFRRAAYLPMGRVADHVASLPLEVVERTAARPGPSLFSDYEVRTFASPAAMRLACEMGSDALGAAPRFSPAAKWLTFGGSR